MDSKNPGEYPRAWEDSHIRSRQTAKAKLASRRTNSEIEVFKVCAEAAKAIHPLLLTERNNLKRIKRLLAGFRKLVGDFEKPYQEEGVASFTVREPSKVLFDLQADLVGEVMKGFKPEHLLDADRRSQTIQDLKDTSANAQAAFNERMHPPGYGGPVPQFMTDI